MREMLFRMAPVVVWLATFSDAKRKLADQRLKHCNINFEAESSLEIHSFLSEFEQQEGYDLGTACKVMWPSSHEVVGLALIEPHSMHHALLELCSDMRAQYNFWSVLDNSVLNAALYYFRVLKTQLLNLPVGLQDTKTGRTTCFFELNTIWASRMFNQRVLGMSAAELARWFELSGASVPNLVLRLPKAIAVLAGLKRFTKVAVPKALTCIDISAGWDSHAGKRDAFSLKLTGLQNSFTSVEPELKPRNQNPDHDQAACEVIDAASMQGRNQILEIMQSASVSLLQGSLVPFEKRQELTVRLNAAAEALQLQDLQQRVFRRDNSILAKARKYGAGKLLEFFWVAGLLHQDKTLRKAIRHACAASLPEDVRVEVLRMIDGDEHGFCLRVPSAATMSRVRARLDVCWTLLFRQKLVASLKQNGGGGVSVYIQTDATWQARQEYQVTLINVVDVGCQLDLHKDRLCRSVNVQCCSALQTVIRLSVQSQPSCSCSDSRCCY